MIFASFCILYFDLQVANKIIMNISIFSKCILYLLNTGLTNNFLNTNCLFLGSSVMDINMIDRYTEKTDLDKFIIVHIVPTIEHLYVWRTPT